MTRGFFNTRKIEWNWWPAKRGQIEVIFELRGRLEPKVSRFKSILHPCVSGLGIWWGQTTKVCTGKAFPWRRSLYTISYILWKIPGEMKRNTGSLEILLFRWAHPSLDSERKGEDREQWFMCGYSESFIVSAVLRSHIPAKLHVSRLRIGRIILNLRPFRSKIELASAKLKSAFQELLAWRKNNAMNVEIEINIERKYLSRANEHFYPQRKACLAKN